MNKEWHKANKMPQNASLEEQICWHMAHVKKCGCRPIPANLLAEKKKRKSG